MRTCGSFVALSPEFGRLRDSRRRSTYSAAVENRAAGWWFLRPHARVLLSLGVNWRGSVWRREEPRFADPQRGA